MSLADDEEGSKLGSPMRLEDEDEDDVDDDEEEDKQQEDEERSSWLEPPPFQIDQRVYAKDSQRNDVYYEAIIRKQRRADKQWTFLVHYIGWNARWDQWVTAQSILEDTPENKRMIQELEQQQQHKHSIATSTNNENTDDNPSARKRRKAQQPDKKKKSQTQHHTHPLVYQDYCELPFTLKTVLMEEFEKISRRPDACHYYSSSKKPLRLVHHLPATVTIRQVLTHFSKKKTKEFKQQQQQQQQEANNNVDNKPSPEQVQEFCQGLSQLFQDALPVCLLYPQERPQYQAMLQQHDETTTVLSKKKEWVDVYGCEYLLRLFVRLPLLLQADRNNSNNTVATTIIGPLLTELLVLLQKNRQACFKGNYREPKPEEWLDWEVKLYGSNESPTTTTTAQHNMDTH